MPVKLKLDPALNLRALPGEDQAPLFFSANEMTGRMDGEIQASGRVELRKRGQFIFADRLRYRQPTDEIEATGQVRLEQNGDVIRGPKLVLNMSTNIGAMETPTFQMASNGARGDALQLLFEGKDKYRLKQTNYTTCSPGKDDWFIKSGQLALDYAQNVGTARNATLEFLGAPIFYTPWMDFSLNNVRKSGFLAPTFGTTSEGGVDITAPYYWNIAPNRDATFAPRLIAKRGLMLNSEYRYLERNYNGQARVELLPNDSTTHTNRYGLNLLHYQGLSSNWSGGWNIQRVSDDTYFTDLSDRISVTSQTNLPQELWLTYNAGWGGFSGRIQRYQTLQDPLAPIVPPYERTPQLVLNAQRLVKGVDYSLTSELVNFSHPSLVNGKRLIIYPNASVLLQTSYAYLTPKLGIHATRYELDQTTTTLTSASRTLPIFSLDSGLFFERNDPWFAKGFMQTLEPRIYYVYIPYKDQSQLPNFDTSIADFNFAQMFTENQFIGGDRINDANQITVAVTSRLINQNTGWERLRFAIGQRYYFRGQDVTLNSSPRTYNASDVIVSIREYPSDKLNFDATWQFNPNQGKSEKISFDARYQPESGKVLNLSYRFIRDTLKQVDVSSQWPLGKGWSSVARWNYSIRDHKVLEALGGLEYNAGCWVLRMVGQRFTTATDKMTNAIFVQLELNEIARIGSNPLDVLRRNIAGYTKVNTTPMSSLEREVYSDLYR